MHRRDWAGTVFVACLIALAELLPNRGMLVGLLLVAAAVSALLIVWDVRRGRKPLQQTLTEQLDEGLHWLRSVKANPPVLAAALEQEVEDWWAETRRALPTALRVRFALEAPWPRDEQRARARLEQVLERGTRCLGTFLKELGAG